MELMVEMLITAFALGGIFGAIVALHLSNNLRQGHAPRTAARLELPREDEGRMLKPVAVDDSARRRRRKPSR